MINPTLRSAHRFGNEDTATEPQRQKIKDQKKRRAMRKSIEEGKYKERKIVKCRRQQIALLLPINSQVILTFDYINQCTV
jgi:hypothetical protein